MNTGAHCLPWCRTCCRSVVRARPNYDSDMAASPGATTTQFNQVFCVFGKVCKWSAALRLDANWCVFGCSQNDLRWWTWSVNKCFWQLQLLPAICDVPNRSTSLHLLLQSAPATRTLRSGLQQ